MAALNTLWGIVRWRWTPFFALVGGSLLYALVVILIVPSNIGRSTASKAEELVVVGDDSSPLSATVGASRTPRSTNPRGFSPPPRAPITPPAAPVRPFVPTPAPEPRSAPPPPPEPVVEPPPPPPEPPPPPPPPPAAEEEAEEEAEPEEEEQQGAAPIQARRNIAGALRVLPPAATPAPSPDDAPEPDGEQ